MPNTVYVDTSLLLAAFIAMNLASPPRWHCCKSRNGLERVHVCQSCSPMKSGAGSSWFHKNSE